jgi:hypothetical protein
MVVEVEVVSAWTVTKRKAGKQTKRHHVGEESEASVQGKQPFLVKAERRSSE